MSKLNRILRVLNLLTKASPARVESMKAGARIHAHSIKRIIESENVVAVGISEKISNKRPTGKLALTFYVEKKLPLTKLRADMVVPPTIPETLSGPQAIPTDVVVLGRMRPEIKAIRNPIEPGFSIGHTQVTAGTLGAIVTKGKGLYLLSNSHVLALNGTAKKGDEIVYPGVADGGSAPGDVIATLYSFKKFQPGDDFVNHVDCALAKPTKKRADDLVSEIKGIGLPKGTIKPKRGMKVVKVGRTTGKTHGRIRDVNFRFVLNYEGFGDVGFIDQVLCTRYSKPGDSGALVLDETTGKAVGLHFSGANGGSVFSPIDQVLKALGVKLITKQLNDGSKPLGTTKKKASKRLARKR